MVWVGGVRAARRTTVTLSFFTALIVAFTSACTTTPTAPTGASATTIAANVSQEPPPVPPRLDPLPPPAALGGTKFVAFGDSITCGTFSSFDVGFAFLLADCPNHSYPARLLLSLRQVFPLQAPAFSVVNGGIPGESAVQGRNRIASVLEKYEPNGLLLLEGINDMNFGASPTATAAAVVSIVDVARTYNVTVLLGLMPQTYESVYPNGQERSQSADLIVPFNNELRRLTAGMQNVHIVDLYSAFGTNRSLMGADGLHPTEAGYEVMAAKFVQAIESVFRVRGSLQ
jgi:lysophospholipase L1-like esterase